MRALRVLVVEDDADHRYFIERALRLVEGLDLDIELVHDGQEALDYLGRSPGFDDAVTPDFIFLDLRMPRRSGLDVLAAMRDDAELRRIPVSVLSSSDRIEDIRATYDLGGNAYIRKSMNFSELARDLAQAARFWGATTVLPGAIG